MCVLTLKLRTAYRINDISLYSMSWGGNCFLTTDWNRVQPDTEYLEINISMFSGLYAIQRCCEVYNVQFLFRVARGLSRVAWCSGIKGRVGNSQWRMYINCSTIAARFFFLFVLLHLFKQVDFRIPTRNSGPRWQYKEKSNMKHTQTMGKVLCHTIQHC